MIRCNDDQGGGWKLKKKYNKKKNDKNKQNFRNKVNGLHPKAVEYLIDHIDVLWVVYKGKVVGGGKPFNVITNSATKKKKNDGNKKKKWWSFK